MDEDQGYGVRPRRLAARSKEVENRGKAERQDQLDQQEFWSAFIHPEGQRNQHARTWLAVPVAWHAPSLKCFSEVGRIQRGVEGLDSDPACSLLAGDAGPD